MKHKGSKDTKQKKKEKKKFLIYHCGALGDFVLTWAGIHLLRKAFPKHHFIAVGRAEYMKLAISIGVLDSFLDMESREIFNLMSGKIIPSELENIDGGVIYLADAQKIISMLADKSSLPVIPVSPFTNDEVHVARYYCNELKKHFPINIPENPGDCFPSRNITPKYALLHPGSGSDKKNFSHQFYRNILNELKKHHSDVRVVLGPVEIEKGFLREYAGEKIETPGSPIALANLLLSASLYIGNDSGVTHLAAYLGVRTIALHKTTNPEIWGAVGKNVKIFHGTDLDISGILNSAFQT